MTRAASQTPPRLRLRAGASDLVALPWRQPLHSWPEHDVPVVEVPLGAARHLVRVVSAGDRLWALKELPREAAEREYDALLVLEHLGVPAVRPAGLVTSSVDGPAVVITEHLQDAVSWQSLLTDPPGRGEQRARVYDAVAVFLVELHRRGVFWGNGSLSALLLRRDGHTLQPFLVDAGTAEVRAPLTDGQRRHDLEVLLDDLVRGLLDLDTERPVHLVRAEAQSLCVRYDALWQALHAQQVLAFGERSVVVSQVARLNGLGYCVDEVWLTELRAGAELHVHAVVAHRRHHAGELRRLTGLQVGEGQATVLLGDLRSHAGEEPAAAGPEVRWWVECVLHPALERLRAALPHPGDVLQDYCDLLEVRWLLSERAGRDVGDEAAVRALAAGGVPAGAAAQLGPVRGATSGQRVGDALHRWSA